MHQTASSLRCGTAVRNEHSFRRCCGRCKYRLHHSQAATPLLLLLTNNAALVRTAGNACSPTGCPIKTVGPTSKVQISQYACEAVQGLVRGPGAGSGAARQPRAQPRLASRLTTEWRIAGDSVWRPENSAESSPADAVRPHLAQADSTAAARSAQTAHQPRLRQRQPGNRYPAFVRLFHRAVAPACAHRQAGQTLPGSSQGVLVPHANANQYPYA